MLVPARRRDPEWMDRPDNAPDALAGALHDIRAVNRWLGGARVIVEGVAAAWRTADPQRPFTILDVGTGGADVPLAIVRAARAAGRPVAIIGIDREPATVTFARNATREVPEIQIERADAFNPGFSEDSFDLVVASMFLHHFEHDEAVRLVAGFRRLARRAVLVNDLRRHALPWAFIAVASRVTRRHPMFVHDAPLSVLRGFTEGELRRIAEGTGARDATIERRWPYRLLMTVPA